MSQTLNRKPNRHKPNRNVENYDSDSYYSIEFLEKNYPDKFEVEYTTGILPKITLKENEILDVDKPLVVNTTFINNGLINFSGKYIDVGYDEGYDDGYSSPIQGKFINNGIIKCTFSDDEVERYDSGLLYIYIGDGDNTGTFINTGQITALNLYIYMGQTDEVFQFDQSYQTGEDIFTNNGILDVDILNINFGINGTFNNCLNYGKSINHFLYRECYYEGDCDNKVVFIEESTSYSMGEYGELVKQNFNYRTNPDDIIIVSYGNSQSTENTVPNLDNESSSCGNFSSIILCILLIFLVIGLISYALRKDNKIKQL